MVQHVDTRRMPSPVVLVHGAIEQRRLFRQHTRDLSTPRSRARQKRRDALFDVALALGIACCLIALGWGWIAA